MANGGIAHDDNVFSNVVFCRVGMWEGSNSVKKFGFNRKGWNARFLPFFSVDGYISSDLEGKVSVCQKFRSVK